MKEFQIGDRVRVTYNKHPYETSWYNDEGIIEAIDGNFQIRITKKMGTDSGYPVGSMEPWGSEDIELIEEEVSKVPEDLRERINFWREYLGVDR